jgi:predicted nucleic acid-binding protein
VRKGFLLDTGPLVAYLDRKDLRHEWAEKVMGDLPGPFLSCEAVLAEACHLLKHVDQAPAKAVHLVATRAVLLPIWFEEEAGALRELMEHYADVPMSFADACLVRMTELLPRTAVITMDRDFLVYRKNRREAIATVMP